MSNDQPDFHVEIGTVPDDTIFPIYTANPAPMGESGLNDLLELYEQFPNLQVFPVPKHLTVTNGLVTNTRIDLQLPDDILFGYFVASGNGFVSLNSGDVTALLTGGSVADCLLVNTQNSRIVFLMNVHSINYAFGANNQLLSLVYWSRR